MRLTSFQKKLSLFKVFFPYYFITTFAGDKISNFTTYAVTTFAGGSFATFAVTTYAGDFYYKCGRLLQMRAIFTTFAGDYYKCGDYYICGRHSLWGVGSLENPPPLPLIILHLFNVKHQEEEVDRNYLFSNIPPIHWI